MAVAEYNGEGLKKLLAKWPGRAAVILVALALLFAGAGAVRWRPGRRSEPPRLTKEAHGAGPLRAGAAEIPLVLPKHAPVAGFPRLVWPDRGTRDPLAVRALVLSEPGCSIALVSAELLLIPGKLGRAVERRVKDLDLDLVLVGATHTHAGPGGYWDETVGERLATGPYDPELFEAYVGAMAAAIRVAAKAQVPAYLSVARDRWPAYARNRAGSREPVDGHIVQLRLRDQAGGDLSEVIVFPAHSAILDLQNRKLSGDWPGFLMRAGRGVRLFFQGALGDQSPHLPGDAPIPTPDVYARALDRHLGSLEPSPGDPWPPLSVASADALLPEVEPGATPPFLRRMATNLLYHLLPARGRVSALRLGPVLLLAVPGEPVAEIGYRWRKAIGPDAEVVSLMGDYLGYIETSEHIAEELGETPRTYYGPELADRLQVALEAAAEAARRDTEEK
jgi:hypothetical protein